MPLRVDRLGETAEGRDMIPAWGLWPLPDGTRLNGTNIPFCF